MPVMTSVCASVGSSERATSAMSKPIRFTTVSQADLKVRLKGIFQRQLDNPRVSGGRNQAEVRAVQCRHRDAKVHSVEYIERLGTELNRTLSDPERSHNPHVDVEPTRTNQAVVFQIAKRTGRRCAERRGIQPPISFLHIYVVGYFVRPLVGLPVQGVVDAGRRGEMDSAARADDRRELPVAGEGTHNTGR